MHKRKTKAVLVLLTLSMLLGYSAAAFAKPRNLYECGTCRHVFGWEGFWANTVCRAICPPDGD